MKPFAEALRYEYPLTSKSVVFDCGGYEGNFAHAIGERYGCDVYCFEPVSEFFSRVCDRVAPLGLDGKARIRVYKHGIGAITRQEDFHIQNDSTGVYAGAERVERCEIRAIDQVMSDLGLDHVDLLKLNIEGMEFEVLEMILEKGLAPCFTDIQVQFHPIVLDYNQRYHAISDGLSKTHELTYHAPWCWENWTLRKDLLLHSPLGTQQVASGNREVTHNPTTIRIA